ncbi:unnamed protein product [Amoebophrya sp. A25]|nr:unnamed protein product [Amoebophrya sp. A25]|eukprot:GSA25T00021071001.1
MTSFAAKFRSHLHVPEFDAPPLYLPFNIVYPEDDDHSDHEGNSPRRILKINLGSYLREHAAGLNKFRTYFQKNAATAPMKAASPVMKAASPPPMMKLMKMVSFSKKIESKPIPSIPMKVKSVMKSVAKPAPKPKSVKKLTAAQRKEKEEIDYLERIFKKANASKSGQMTFEEFEKAAVGEAGNTKSRLITAHVSKVGKYGKKRMS